LEVLRFSIFFVRQDFASTAQIYNALDPSFLALDHCGYSHIQVSNNTVQHPIGNSPDLRSSLILEKISGLRIVSTYPVF